MGGHARPRYRLEQNQKRRSLRLNKIGNSQKKLLKLGLDATCSQKHWYKSGQVRPRRKGKQYWCAQVRYQCGPLQLKSIRDFWETCPERKAGEFNLKSIGDFWETRPEKKAGEFNLCHLLGASQRCTDLANYLMPRLKAHLQARCSWKEVHRNAENWGKCAYTHTLRSLLSY